VFAVAQAREALDTGAVDLARARIDALCRAHPDEPRVLQLRHDLAVREGDLAEQVRALHRMHLASPGDHRLALERRALGELLVTEPGWLPRIPGPVEPRPAATPGAVLHLTEDSFALGPWYPRETPVDELLAVQVWLAAAKARETAPEIIHATSGERGYLIGLVGLALRSHIGRPVVYEATAIVPRGTGDGRREAAEMRVLLDADHVVVPTAELEAEIVGRGIPAGRVTVVDAAAEVDAAPDGHARPVGDATLGQLHAMVVDAWAGAGH
jgi:hypothetical protein